MSKGECLSCNAKPEPETRVAFRGSDAWLLAVLEALDIDPAVARTFLSQNRKRLQPANNPKAPMGTGAKGLGPKWWVMVVTVCPKCAGEKLDGITLGTKAQGEIPTYDEAWR